ncbi:MAG: transcription elongation factor GreA [Actinomycetota bacterium]|nr:transcription elongation factor GreA [Actinomycetota bacterium]
MDSITMTAEELENVQRELHYLESTGRTEIAARIKTAREWGDLKENAEYHTAKEEQAHLETRILKLRDSVRGAVVVETSGTTDIVEHGSTVTYTDVASGREQTFRIVSPHEAKPSQGTLSAQSPIAKALVGRRAGEVVEVQTPAGPRELQIAAIG